ncbi:MAG: 3-oxoacyl-[acyl-carrier-protein] reductase [Clostridia bacterium]|nr:3-oxoacyl-[acyl-carrier-protein] reductase [Clostridia bacterium]
MMDLSGKNAVVTGSSRGIGKAIALKLASLGANIAVVYAGNAEKAAETVSEIEALGVKAKAYMCNVADFAEVKTLVADIITEFGGIDILVNNAGIIRDGLVLSMKEEDFDKVIDVNLKGSFNMIKNTYQHFMKKRRGRIINISSIVGINGNAGQANYASAKAGIIGLTKSVAKELAARNVTVNAIAPGYIETDMTNSMPEKAKEAVMSSIPMKRVGQGEDIANAVAFLASDEAAYITGEVIKVDGGMAI